MDDTTKKANANDAVDVASVHDGSLDEKAAPQSDNAAEFLHLHESKYSNYSLQDAKKVLRKIDWRLMPLMWITTNISAIDVSSQAMPSSGQHLTLKTENHHIQCSPIWYDSRSWPGRPAIQLGLVFTTCFLVLQALTVTVGSIFYFGFLAGEWPFGPVIQRLPIAKLLSATVVAWGALTLLMGATQNAAGMMTLRFLMGAFEAPLYPMMSIMTVMWYKKSEQPIRVTV